MQPRLLAISGPTEGRTLLLTGERVTLGRHPDCDLQLASLEVSRNHCELRRDDDGHYRVVDLGSRHGVFVNNRPVQERRLAHSDLLGVGGSLLLFLLDEPSDTHSPAPEASARSASERRFVAASTIVRKPTEIFYLDRGRVDTALPPEARLARDLHALLRAGQSLQGPLSVPELAKRLLATLFEVVPAHRGAVLLCEPGGDALRVAAQRSRDPSSGADETSGAATWQADRATLDQVRADGAAVLAAGESSASDVAPRNGSGQNVSGQAGALLCVPLHGHENRLLGALYAEHPSTGGFEERHLELLGAVAAIGSLSLQNALHLSWLRQENERLRTDQLDHDLVGESAAVRRLLDLIAKVARADSTVLLRGESGTGKELAAQAIHRSSPRAEGPFVAINCATLSETLLESELFGHEKGAFTGAVERKLGKLEVARGGTLFLDEVAELPATVQAKLLRVLAERKFERVGGSRPLEADVRIVAATHRDLEKAIEEGAFRADLYYRLKVITLETPPLRQRRDDIPLLASHFAALHGKKLGKVQVGIAPDARRGLLAYDWPGNVRELGNAVERALVLGDGDVIRREDLPDEVIEGASSASEAPTSDDFQSALTTYKKKLVIDAYQKAGGDYSAAADLLGVHVNSLHRMISRLGIRDRLEG